jgi:uncharacterized protein (DUF362 family)
MGMCALMWFLIRVIPKPSRASYPCQRAAFPVATGFVIWLVGFIASYFSLTRVKQYFRAKRPLALVLILLVLVASVMVQLSVPFGLAGADPVIPDKSRMVPMEDWYRSDEERPVVSIVRSREALAEDITTEEIQQMVRQAVEMAGGLDDLISDGDVVVIKPNLVNAYQDGETQPLRPKVNGVTTDYRVIQATVGLVRELNPTGRVLIMEGSAFGNTRDNMQKMGWPYIPGVDQFIGIEDSSGGMRDYNSDRLVKRSLPPGKNLFKSANNIYYFNKTYIQADVIISLPVLKTHSSAAFTGSIKNVAVGAAPASIYGDESGATNLRWPFIDHAATFESPLHDWIHDYYLCRPVDFVIMDALTGLELGPGINAGTDQDNVRKNTRCIMAGKDALALDAIGALAVQVDPARVRYLVTLHNDGAGCADPRYIRICGLPLDQIREPYRNHATYARYTDFTGPKVSVLSYNISSDTLYLSLKTEYETQKIEISVNDTLLGDIYTTGFNNMKIALGQQGVRAEDIKLFAYDHFLNPTMLNLNLPSALQSRESCLPALRVFPNPFRDCLNLSVSDNRTGSMRIILTDMSGKEIRTLTLDPVTDEPFVIYGLGDLPDGMYILTVMQGGHQSVIKIAKQ